jgi:alkanesulfonate monooxygenase SsuD/methylene tetrahydromethanopterin reductase-like flavin-dependent oxidoreductase (luciferase family)
VEVGVHLPLMDFGGHPYRLDHLTRYAETADRLGYTALSVNDHLVFDVPWLDGSIALAAVLGRTGQMELVTTVALPVIRGPVPVAKALAAIDCLSGGRLIAGIGPGSSARDYAAVGLEFSERWARLDEAVQALRALWHPDRGAFMGRFYSTEGLHVDPPPSRPGGLPIWIGSWGSPAGLRRVARLGDGWLASAYNTTPELFAQALASLAGRLADQGKDPAKFPNALATMWCYVTDDDRDAARVLRERVAPAVHRAEDVLRSRLAIGRPERIADKLNAFAEAGVRRVFIWPVDDEIGQLERFAAQVLPAVAR